MRIIKGLEDLYYEGRLKEMIFSPWRREDSGGFSFPVIESVYKKERGSLLRGSHMKRANKYKMLWERFLLAIRKYNFFSSESNQSLK